MEEYDVESNNAGSDDVASSPTPYSSMAKPNTGSGNNGIDGLAVAGTSSTREDSHIRSLAKGLTWRFIASGTTIVIAKIVTGETTVAFQIGFFEFFAKIMIYYVHERIWAKIRL
eukprot:CAMPEP_0168191398 /NCGR_PEP_ID=MMETSP0139_2-20121125/17498_1 /TAXON_ID=44445 /ORGANISM="Pseudo-nitzschia australis, Strain 10249 10 AB" /LENGTH=113 /DNA_ID=CAMNT_0008114577 /DNA_START=418 /DNA_END=759 /DNA_ORIENTATION=+